MNCKQRYTALLLTVVFAQLTLNAQLARQSDTISLGKEEKVNILYGIRAYDHFIGNMDAVRGDKLRNYPNLVLSEALAGQLPGVFMLQDNGNPGEDNFTSYIRGSVGEYITLVDGIERPINPYDIEQIEEIKVLKDPVSKALYGGRMTNGIILVTTRRGRAGTSEFHATVQRGMKMPTVLPKYLNSFDFATYYNKALANDNISTGLYSQAALDGYQNGTNLYQYPNVDFYDQFLNKSMDMTRISTEYYGGNERTKFYFHGGYQKEGGLERYGDRKRQMQLFNLQGNLDSRFSDDITLHANFAGYVANKQYPGGLGGVILGTLASRYPNAYPIFVSRDSAGGTSSFKDNPFAQQAQSGYTRENNLRIQTDLAFDFKLDKLIKGLTFKPMYSFDIYHKQNLQKLNTVGIYNITGYDLNGVPSTFNTIQQGTKATSQSLGDDDYGSRWGFTNILSYQRTFHKHALDADAVYFIAKSVYAGDLQDYERQNLGLRVNYTFNEKYTLEGVLNYCGSQSYATNNRFKTFPALGAGWLISKEAFAKDINFLDFLKLNASWGIAGDGNININQYKETWGATASYAFNTSTTNTTVQLNQVASPLLDWPQQQELDISLEAKMFKNLGWKFSYFDYVQSGLLSKQVNVIPLIVGGNNFLPLTNFGETGLKGFEAQLSYSGNAGRLKYDIGTHFTYGKSNKILIDELADPNYTTQGTPWDAIRGYEATGTYSQDDISQILTGNSKLALPSYMDPKALRVGNIKYKDVNGDRILDKYDTRIIGNNAPRILYGANLGISYKGIGLYAVLVGYGQYKRLLNNSFYQVNSTRKYSIVVVDGLPNGNPYPQLTTGTGANDFQNSSYWIVNGGFMKLKNLALSYSLPERLTKRLKTNEVKFSIYGTNLFTVSKITKSDPESLNAGLADYPLFRTFAAGLTVTF